MRLSLLLLSTLLLISCVLHENGPNTILPLGETLFNSPQSPQSEPDYILLADEALLNTPEYLHFSPGTKFVWCFYERPENDPLPSVTDALIAKLSNKYTVYLKRDDIPKDRLIFHNGRLAGYDNGFSYQVRFELLSKTKVKIHYSDWEGTMAASGHYKVYEWNGQSWEITEKSPLVVS